ncbi:para-aminobenzoate synthetase component 1 [Halopseudomonas yangmingensis]|uniref:aminodeoxychorismate synthase n=1 Tax=Halopseudomonas yangmingensis TaxID=1720063 RepID=A0A1I4RK66_9GAMM|nr:para-aminobenzoate synthetase component 1 [Halopseudomonas yangmingensis]
MAARTPLRTARVTEPAVSAPCYRLHPLPYQADASQWLLQLRHLPQPLLLDSAAGNLAQARYSLVSAAPLRVLDASDNSHPGDWFDRLRSALAELGPARWPDQPLPFGAGLIGFLSYDFGRLLESLPSRARADIQLPLARFGLYAWVLLSDHQLQRSWLVSHPRCSQDVLKQVQQALQQPAEAPARFSLAGSFIAEQSRADYQQSFQRIQQYIQAGDCYQINLTQRFSANCGGDSLDAWLRLRQACPTPFAACFSYPEASILSLSPERFLHLHNGLVETRPIKGTRPRGSTAQQDQALAEELRQCSKDRAENLMIVDLLRNDLGRSCQPGSVQVPELFAIEHYPNVHHLVSSVTGTLASGQDAFDLLAGAFPGGSITGAPKIRAMQIIEELEPVRRSLYCGSLGYIGCEGQMDMNITIRTLIRQQERIHVWGGGGIVADSDADAEYQESLTKVQVLMQALENHDH